MFKNYKRKYEEYKNECDIRNTIIRDKIVEINDLKERLSKAETLERVLDKIWSTVECNSITLNEKFTDTDSLNVQNITGGDPAIYVDDYLGGKVIKQEATKLIKISNDGTIIEGYTKKDPDKGYRHKIVREDFI